MTHLNLALVAAILAAPVMASAEEPIPQKARKLAEHGREMHDKGDYARAIIAFKEAYVIAPSPGLLFNLAQAYRLQGNCDDASLMYRRYIATNPAPDARAIAEGHLYTVERCAKKRALNIPLDESMAYLNVPPPPGPEQVIVQARHDTTDRATRPTRLKQDVGLGVTLGGSAALVLAGYFGYRSYDASQEVEAAYARGAKWKEIEAIHDRGESSARAAKIFGIGGGLAVASGVTLFLLGKREERAMPLAVTPRAQGAEVSYAWEF